MRISPRLAALLLRANTDPRQRHFDGERTEAHRRRIVAGTFAAAPPICFTRDLAYGRLVLHNGQHRLAAIAAGGVPVDLDVRVHDDACPLMTAGD